VEKAAIDRFESKYIPEPNSGCWIWTGSTSRGYGYFTDSKVKLAHRVSYQWFVGPIPTGLVVDHLCNVSYCVNPKHLQAITQRENVIKGQGLAAKQFRQTHCIRGHAFDSVNTYVNPEGRRQCKLCRRAIDRKRDANK